MTGRLLSLTADLTIDVGNRHVHVRGDETALLSKYRLLRLPSQGYLIRENPVRFHSTYRC